MAELRDQLRRAAVDPAGAKLFTVLYPSWCYSAGALLSLCFVAQAYDHAVEIVHAFADLPFGAELLVQIDRLVALLETPCFTFLRALLRVFRAAQLRQYEAYVEQRRPPPLMPVGTAGPGVTFAASVTDRPTTMSTADKGGVPYLPGAGAAPSSGLGLPDVMGRPAGGAVSPPPGNGAASVGGPGLAGPAAGAAAADAAAGAAAAVSAAAMGVAQVLSFADEGTEPVMRGASGVLSGGGPSFGDGSALLAAAPADAQLAQQMAPQQLQNQTQQRLQGGGPASNPEAVRGQLHHVSSVGSN
ncbi:hypothetical protein PLESTM_001239300 [Pleodorina starrii]|nr:hypothetical protein PLESTM_001239300 [Pleodorina starrii]